MCGISNRCVSLFVHLVVHNKNCIILDFVINWFKHSSPRTFDLLLWSLAASLLEHGRIGLVARLRPMRSQRVRYVVLCVGGELAVVGVLIAADALHDGRLRVRIHTMNALHDPILLVLALGRCLQRCDAIIRFLVKGSVQRDHFDSLVMRRYARCQIIVHYFLIAYVILVNFLRRLCRLHLLGLNVHSMRGKARLRARGLIPIHHLLLAGLTTLNLIVVNHIVDFLRSH